MLSLGKKNYADTLKWDIEDILGGVYQRKEFSVEGNLAKEINSISSLGEALDTDLAFCSYVNESGIKQISESKAGIILCKKNLKDSVHPKKGSLLVFLDNPRLAFVMFANKMQTESSPRKGTTIGTSSVIEKDVIIGTNCYIGNFVTIGRDCVIGDNTVIHDRVTITQNCRIGKNCMIQSGVTLGEDGFAYERHQNNELEKFPHLKGIVIGDSVEIYANTNIARGSLTDTEIGDGTRIDAMVHIAHNVKIGRNCLLTGGTIIGGSAVIGNSCWTGLNCTIKNKVTLGNNVIVGSGASVIHNVSDGDIVAGVPAKSIKDKVSTDEIFLMTGKKT
ncbi:MAG TPA: UDP-3-O-(3-hydroxymyristoyl)glucosamine N-acyltransferase [Nitrosopumilaceae archaeon]|nr:UDP-3-O-(3-hydroxymyristoyl)glucosamine N-acyltransferase [Nitrosopumilaceae archaeon]